MQFSKRLDRFGDEVFASLNARRTELEAAGREVIDLSVGTPDYADRFGVTGLTPDMIMSCNGTQEGMGRLSSALVDEGDLVLVPDPCYPLFRASALIAGAELAFYPLNAENNFLPNVAEIPDEVADRAKYMIVSLPANPVGSVGTPEVYAQIIEFAKAHDVLIVHDNAYSDIIYDGVEGHSFFENPGASEVGVEFFSLSKSFDVTGARISFLVGRPDVVAAVRKIRSQSDYGMFLPIQHAAIAALTPVTENKFTTVVLSRENVNEWLSVRNIPTVHPIFADQLNTYDVVTAQYVVFSKEGFDAFLAAKAEPAAKEA